MTSIQAPPDFPVVWEQPEDEHRFWEREAQHFPYQVSALDRSLLRRMIDHGFNAAFAEYGMPVRNAYRCFNTYAYQSIAPVSHDPAELERLGGKAGENLVAVVARLGEWWDTEQLPELQRKIDWWESLDLDNMSREELAGVLDETVKSFEDAWRIHFLTVVPTLLGMSLFDDFYKETLGAEDPFEPFKLLQGFDNLSLESDRALYSLREQAEASPAVAETIRSTESAATWDALAALPDGVDFLTALSAYLDRYGKRYDGYLSFSQPSWIEDPTPVFTALREHLNRPERDFAGEQARLAAERDGLIAAARERLAGYPAPVVGQFELFLKGAQEGSVLQENHNFWIDSMTNYEVRRVLLAVGRVLADAGAIDERDDVFHLSLDEVRDQLRTPGDARSTVAERKAELERFADVTAPPVLGTLPPGPPPNDPITRAIMKMFGGPLEAPTDPKLIVGMPGSPGVMRGRVRRAYTLADGQALQDGEVLVTETTSPPWTPLFATAGAVVTDTGGVLSHCAVVAREYMIPAVVGTKLATARLRDGMLVEVDGAAGEVRILEDA